MLNIQSIIFGLNLLNIITIVLNFNKIKFKNNKLFIYLLLCLIGFIYHLSFIFNKIIHDDLIYSQYFKLMETMELPDLVFCIKYDQNLIDLNYKLTYEYLDKITNEIKINKFIYEIKYLNKSNKWIKLNNNSNINIFYFLDQKCFEIKLNLNYSLNQFKVDYMHNVIKISSNKSFIEKIN